MTTVAVHKKTTSARTTRSNKWKLPSLLLLLQKSILLLFFIISFCLFYNYPAVDVTLPPPTPPPIKIEEILNHPEQYLYQRYCSSVANRQKPTLDSIQQCYPDAFMVQNNSSCFSSNKNKLLDWNFVQNCINGRRSSSSKITQIHVLGERNSGTKWIQQTLEACFDRKYTSIRSHRDFIRSKHFFQPPSKGNFESSLVVVIVRNPYQWVAAMREKPYHMPSHIHGFSSTPTTTSSTDTKRTRQKQKQEQVIPLEWSEFIQRSKWSMLESEKRTPDDSYIIQNHQQFQTRCVQGFAFNEVVPCYFDNTTLPRSKWRGHVPIYELQRLPTTSTTRSTEDEYVNGIPFDDLLKLRSNKIMNFVLEIPLTMKLGGYYVVRYEDLLAEGTKPFLSRIAKEMLDMPNGLPQHCLRHGKLQLQPQPERLLSGKRIIPLEAKQWIEKRLVRETEHLLGYDI